MAEDVRKAVISSLKCTLTETKIIGSHDVEFHISVHVEEDQSCSFIDLVKSGSVQLKTYSLEHCAREVSNGCKECGKNVICREKELELKLGVTDTETVCHTCNDKKSVTTTPKRKGRRGRKPRSELTKHDLIHSSPIVVLERLDDGEEIFESELVSASAADVNTSKDVSLLQTPVASEKTDESSQNVRRSSRTTKSRFRRSATGDEEETDSPFIYFDLRPKSSQFEKKIGMNSDDDRKQNELKKSPEKKVKPKKFKKTPKRGRTKQVAKKGKVSNDDITLYLSESDKEDEVHFDDDDADPDFVVDENVDDEEIDAEEIAKEYLSKLEQADKIKMEPCESFLPKSETVESGLVTVKREDQPNESNNTSKEIKIVKVSVPDIHQEEFPCNVCYKSYILRRYLVRHQNKAGSEPLLCDVCGAKFHYQKEVEQHKLAHTGVNPYLCEVCNRSFPNLSQVNKHVKNHLPPHERPFICAICGKGFTESHSLHEHSLIHAEVKPYECEKCDAKFAARYLLHAHLKYHSSKTYRCYTCNRVYKVFASLKEHLLIYKDHYTKDEPEPIQKLPVERSDAPRTRERKRKRKSLTEQKFDATKKVESLRTVEDSGDESVENKTDPEITAVDKDTMLSLNFNKECLDLIGHVEEEKTVEKEDQREEDDSEIIEASQQRRATARKIATFPCKICFRRYLSQANLNKHYAKCGRICVPCNQCKAKFHSKQDRKQHQLLHSGVHPYQCKVCFKSFANLSKCKTHTASHLPTNRRPFVCETCGRGYPFPHQLEKHKLMHGEEGTIKCHICSVMFISKSAYGRHMDVHSGSVYRCDTCEKEYKYPSSLKDHLKKFKHTSDDKRIQFSYFKPKHKRLKTKQTVVCDICGKSYASINALIAHQKIHKDVTAESPADKESLKQFALKKHLERIESHRAKIRSNPGNAGHFKCEECGQEFKLRASLRRHSSLKHGNCKHQCKVCQKRFFIPSELERHMLSHFGERSFQCMHCPRSFYHEFGLRRHLKIHIAKEKLAHGCNVCGKKFIEACYLREHMRRHTGEKPFKCEICGKAYITKNLLKQHMISHGPKKHGCKICGKCFAHVSNFNAHMRKHEGIKYGYTYLCDDCGKSFSSKSGLSRHKIKHLGIRNFKCQHPGCSRSFFFKQELKNHERSHQDVKPFQCDACGKAFKYQTSFNNHLRSHKDLPPLRCEICGKEYYVASRLKRHMQHHLGDRTLECDQCEKRFITKADLNYHKKQHERTYECQECQKVFKLETRLKSHMRIHEGPEKVKCPRCDVFYKDLPYLQTTHFKFCDTKKMCIYCGRRFGSIRKLQSHIGVHTGKRPHECDECGAAFTTPDQLQKHQERHRNKRYKCRLCEKGFDRLGDLEKHELIHKKREDERKKVEEYKYRVLQEEIQNGNIELEIATTSNNFVREMNQMLVFQPSDDQRREDILAQAAASIIQEGELQMEGGTVVQYVNDGGEITQDYAHIVELETSSLIQEHSVPVSTEQVILTTIDASQLQGHEGNEILMVAMIPEQQ